MAKTKKKIVKVVKKSKPVKKAVKVAKKASKPAAKKTVKAVAKKTAVKTKSTAKAPAKKVSKQKPTAAKKVTAPTFKFKEETKTTQKIKIADLNSFVTPLDDRMIVQVKETEKRTAGGLYIPDTAILDVSHHEAIVLSVGRGHRDLKGRLRPMDVKVGDKILFNSMSGSKLVYQNVDLKILRETDVMGVVDKD